MLFLPFCFAQSFNGFDRLPVFLFHLERRNCFLSPLTLHCESLNSKNTREKIKHKVVIFLNQLRKRSDFFSCSVCRYRIYSVCSRVSATHKRILPSAAYFSSAFMVSTVVFPFDRTRTVRRNSDSNNKGLKGRDVSLLADCEILKWGKRKKIIVCFNGIVVILYIFS